jgi:hypothetical protein
MPIPHSAAIAQKHLLLQNRSKHLSIPLYHILILAWSALFILYGETGLPPPFFSRYQEKDGVGSVASC